MRFIIWDGDFHNKICIIMNTYEKIHLPHHIFISSSPFPELAFRLNHSKVPKIETQFEKLSASNPHFPSKTVQMWLVLFVNSHICRSIEISFHNSRIWKLTSAFSILVICCWCNRMYSHICRWLLNFCQDIQFEIDEHSNVMIFNEHCGEVLKQMSSKFMEWEKEKEWEKVMCKSEFYGNRIKLAHLPSSTSCLKWSLIRWINFRQRDLKRRER